MSVCPDYRALTCRNTSLPLANRVPFIFLSEARSRRDELRGRNLGADDYVTKPVDFDILEAIVRARLIKGVVRREISTTTLAPLPRGIRDRVSSDEALWAQIVELIDAPTVDLHSSHPKPSLGEVD
jgi:DNA-binding response OmpR family regulator